MSRKPHPAVGIDLGTTYSAVASLDDLGRPQTLANAEGDKLTPSAALFEGDHVIVGKEAIKALGTEADQVATCAKRELGYRFYHKPLGGRQYPPEALQAFILDKLRRDAGHQIGPITKAVVTVPAYFDEVRRKKTQDAGYMAGLEVLDIINEPTAAAVAFGFQQAIGSGATDRPQKILVFDLGGGTFDVTVLQIKGAEFTALATDGDVMLGGQDWDERLVNYVADQFMRRHGFDPRQNANTVGRLWRDCEDAKRTLSAREKTSVAVDHQGLAMRLEVSRQQLEEMTFDLLERTAFTSRQTLEAAGLQWQDLDRILLVGGATRMPAVRRMLRELSGHDLDTTVSPDEAVAHGAALRAGWLLARDEGRPLSYRIQNVNSHSLGVVATDPATRRERIGVLIPRNTPLPVSARRVFKTRKAHQKSILIRIVEGESPTPEGCVELGQCVVKDLPAQLPLHTPIDVRFEYQENGRLLVRVAVEGMESELKHELERENTITREQLNDWRQHISKLPPPELMEVMED